MIFCKTDKRLEIALGFWFSTKALILGLVSPAFGQIAHSQLPISTTRMLRSPSSQQSTIIKNEAFKNQVTVILPLLIAQNQSISLPPNITQLLEDFELTPVECTAGVATISIGPGTVCVQASDRIPAGNYIYDSATDQIRPSQHQVSPTNSVQNQSTPSSNAPTQTSATRSTPQFTFTNVLEYSDCVEDILQFYQDHSGLMQRGRRSNCVAEIFQNSIDTGFSREQALELVRDADAYATSVLSPGIYPPVGIRRRVAQELGFTYALDGNN